MFILSEKFLIESDFLNEYRNNKFILHESKCFDWFLFTEILEDGKTKVIFLSDYYKEKFLQLYSIYLEEEISEEPIKQIRWLP